MPIPKIFHQIWLSKDGVSVDRPAKKSYQQNVQDLIRLNPDFTYMWWSNEQIEKLFDDPLFTKYKSQFDQMSPHICKCDFARYMIMYKYGGVYFDLDFKFFNCYPPSLLEYDLVMFHEPDFPRNFSHEYSFEHITGVNRILANNILSSAPGNTMWVDLMDSIMDVFKSMKAKGHGIDSIGDVVSTTGPQIVNQKVWEYLNATSKSRDISYHIEGDRSLFFFPKTPSSVSHNDWGDSTGWVSQMRMEEGRGRFLFVIVLLIIGIVGLIFIGWLIYRTVNISRKMNEMSEIYTIKSTKDLGKSQSTYSKSTSPK